MSKSAIKFYLIPFITLIIVITVIIIFSLAKRPSPNSNSSQSTSSPTPIISLSPTPHLINITPTLIPPQSFTGADANQELPADLKNVGEQKTALRRITPLTLPFGIITFDYGNDIFLVHLLDPKTDSKTKFDAWRLQNYPALTENKFVFNL